MKFVTPEIAWNYDIEQINSLDLSKTYKELVVCSSDSTNQNIFLRFWNFNIDELFPESQRSKFCPIKI